MTITNVHFTWMWAWSNDSDGNSFSVQLNFSPHDTLALTSLSQASGDGLCDVGISEFRFRPVANGPDHTKSFAWTTDFGFRPFVHDPHMTSVTAQLTVGGDGQQGVASLTTWFLN